MKMHLYHIKEFDGRQPTGWATVAYISERSRNSKYYDPHYFSFLRGGGHTSSTILNSCSFQRYRPLFVKASSFFFDPPFIINQASNKILTKFKRLESTTIHGHMRWVKISDKDMTKKGRQKWHNLGIFKLQYLKLKITIMCIQMSDKEMINIGQK